MSLPQENLKYTYKDYLRWLTEERLELIDGIVFDMTPSPSRLHQEILGELFKAFSLYFEDKACNVYCAPLDVRLPGASMREEDIFTVVQPDIAIVCDMAKLDERGCEGAPDLVVEIISPSTVQKDMVTKLNLYEMHRVREYWIVHPTDRTVMILTIGDNGRYGRPLVYTSEDEAKAGIFPELVIDLKRIFPRA